MPAFAPFFFPLSSHVSEKKKRLIFLWGGNLLWQAASPLLLTSSPPPLMFRCCFVRFFRPKCSSAAASRSTSHILRFTYLHAPSHEAATSRAQPFTLPSSSCSRSSAVPTLPAHSSGDASWLLPIRVVRLSQRTAPTSHMDLFVQCYDYLVRGVGIQPPPALEAWVSYLKSPLGSDAAPVPISSQPRGSRLSSNEAEEVILLDVMVLPYRKCFLGWFHFFPSHAPLAACSSWYRDASCAWQTNPAGCVQSRQSLIHKFTQSNYEQVWKMTILRSFFAVLPRDLSAVHSRHVIAVRHLRHSGRRASAGTFHMTQWAMLCFTKSLCGDPLPNRVVWERVRGSELGSREATAELRFLGTLCRHVLQSVSCTSTAGQQLLAYIVRQCRSLKLESWYSALVQLKGLPDSDPSSTLTSPLDPIIKLTHDKSIDCPLYAAACELLRAGGHAELLTWSHTDVESRSSSSNEKKSQHGTFYALLYQEIQRMLSELMAEENSILSDADVPQLVDSVSNGRPRLPSSSTAVEAGGKRPQRGKKSFPFVDRGRSAHGTPSIASVEACGLVDASYLAYPPSLVLPQTSSMCSPPVPTASPPPSDPTVLLPCLLSPGLDYRGYRSYALHACDILLGLWGAGGKQANLPKLVRAVQQLRHALRVHHLRRYASGATSVWDDGERCAQGFPFYAAVSLSLQVRSTMNLLHFSVGSEVTSEPCSACPRSLHLLSLLYPKLTPAPLSAGSVEPLLKYPSEGSPAPFVLACRRLAALPLDSSSSSFVNLDIPLSLSQTKELQQVAKNIIEESRSVVRGGATTGGGTVVVVGMLVKEGNMFTFFDPHKPLPTHHIA